MGPAGTGKSAIATQFVSAAAARGEPTAIFLFEERTGTLCLRAEHLGMDIASHVSSGLLKLHQVDPAELAPDQFTHLVRGTVERDGARVVVIDSLNGYLTAMPEARFLTLQLHELLSFLADRGVATIMTVAQAGAIGQMRSPVDVSYLADTVLLLRYFEAHGAVRKAISVLKKRSGHHEDTIRELTLDKGLRVGAPLSAFRGVLTGVPVYVGDDARLGSGAPK
jgi:circadian clock protein KaiC